MKKKCLITGERGFVGSFFMGEILAISPPHDSIEITFLPEKITPSSDFSQTLQSVSCVIHLAARVHSMEDKSIDPSGEYMKVNFEGTMNLARQAANAYVKRFIFISTIKVNGERTEEGKPFHYDDQATPFDPYAVSKYEAEQGLMQIAQETGMEVVIIRPPLVYGPGVKANFLNLMKLADSSLPLPFLSIKNARSMIYVENLAAFIVHCIDHPLAANRVFLVSDNQDVSLSRLLRLMRKSLERPVRLFCFPSFLLKGLAIVAGKRELVDRLLGDLSLDPEGGYQLLDWKPPYSLEEGLEKTIKAYSETL